MAVYTDITDRELATFLADFDLGRAITFKGIAEGVENSNFLLETGAGRYILTLYERRARPEDLPFFLRLMGWLDHRGYPSAAPITDRGGRVLKSIRGKPAALIAFKSGISVRRPLPGHCAEAGKGLARLHLAAQGFPMRRFNDLGFGAWAAMAASLAPAAELLEPGIASILTDDLAMFARSWPVGIPAGIIHADYFPDNVLFLEDRHSATIDFYFAAWDCLAYDIGIALNAWCFEDDGGFDAANATAFLHGYREIRPLSPEETAALPILAWGAAMRFFLTRLADWKTTPPGALVRPKDPLAYARRLATHRAGTGIDRLLGNAE